VGHGLLATMAGLCKNSAMPAVGNQSNTNLYTLQYKVCDSCESGVILACGGR
jgi:hypothetical protein